jgi:hypothetical protein
MDWANPALWTAIAALVTAIGGVIGLFVHVNGASDKTPPAPPQA